MSKAPLPPFPSISALAQTTRFFKDPFSLVDQCHRELGDIFTLRLLGMGNWVFVSAPEHIKEVFKAPPDVLVSGEINANMLGFMLGTDATFSLDGDAHIKRRKMMLPFFNGREVLGKINLLHSVVDSELDRWPKREPFPFLPWSMHTSLLAVLRLVFSGSTAEELSGLTVAFESYAEKGLRSPLLMLPFLQLDLGRFSPWGRILELRRRAFETFDAAIAQRRADPARYGQSGEVASWLCNWRDEQGSLTNETIRDEIFNDLFAGHETTAKILAWALECALTFPHTMARLQEEIDSVLGGQPIRAEHLKSLPYTLAFLEETRRMRPLAPFAGVRLAKQEFSLGSFSLPPGTTIVQCLPLLAQRPELFKNPESFQPERFMDMTIKPYTWNPFGGGRRMCLGKGLAEVELAVFLVTLISRFEVTLAQPKVERVRAGFFFAPSQDLQIEVEPRRLPKA